MMRVISLLLLGLMAVAGGLFVAAPPGIVGFIKSFATVF